MNDATVVDLTGLWYSIVNLDHHKDKDCHWYINKTYSYGSSPIYNVEHYGYVYEEIHKTFTNYTDAQSFIILHLIKAIRNQCYGEFEFSEQALKLAKESNVWNLIKLADHSVE